MNLARAEEQRKRAEDEMKKSRILNSQVSTFSRTETELRSQLNIYVEKFKQVGLRFSALFAILWLALPTISNIRSAIFYRYPYIHHAAQRQLSNE